MAKGKTAAKKKPAKAKATPKKPGRPSSYSPELADEICRLIAKGESLSAICANPKMPCDDTVAGWAVDDVEGFFGKYTRAKQMRCFHYADEIVEIADESSRDYRIIKKGGREIEIPDKEHMMRSTLKVDTRKWLMVKFLPKVFGDRLQLTGELLHRRVTAEEAAEALKKRIAQNKAKYEAK